MDVNQRCRVVNSRTPRARALGNALREVRVASGTGLRQFAKQIGRDASLLSRWESGERTPTPTDVAQILGKLGVTGDRYDDIIELAQGIDNTSWLATTLPEQRAQLNALVDFERDASAITDVSPLLVPGLLQTSDYTRAIMTDGGVPADEIGTRVAIRLGRRDVITRPDPVPYRVLIGEAALRQLIGTRQIMADQLQFVMGMAERPNVEIRLIPFDAGWHEALVGASIIIESTVNPSVTHLEVRDTCLFLHARQDVARYRAATDKVAARAMSPEDSLAVIALVKAGWESA